MNQGDEIKALRAEIAELKALVLALAARPVQVINYPQPAQFPQQPWYQPWDRPQWIGIGYNGYGPGQMTPPGWHVAQQNWN